MGVVFQASPGASQVRELDDMHLQGIHAFWNFLICDPTMYFVITLKALNLFPFFNALICEPKFNAFFLDFLGVKTRMQICSKIFEPILRFYYIKCLWNS